MWEWWNTEIAPWSHIILGAGEHEARRVEALPPLEKWQYIKYRYDALFYYPATAPPPIEMWLDNIFDVTSPQATEWFRVRDVREAMAEWLDSSEDQVCQPQHDRQ